MEFEPDIFQHSFRNAFTIPFRYLLTLTCIFLRTLIITSIYNIFALLSAPATGEPWDRYAILQFVILIHHGFSVWYIWLNPAILDWLLISGELATWFGLHLYGWQVDRWSSTKYMVLLGSLYAQLVALISLWFIRGVTMVPLGPFLPLNLLNLDYAGESQPLNKKFWKERLQLIFGRALWRSAFKGKHRPSMVLRASFALVTILGMLIFGVFSVIIWPVTEMSMIPLKTFMSPSLRWDLESLNPAWNVFVVVDRDLGTSVIRAIPDAVHVTALWEDFGPQVDLCTPRDGPAPKSDKPKCQYIGSQFTDADPSLTYNTPMDAAVYSFRYFCPNRCIRNLTLLEFMGVPARDTMPDLLVTVNFTSLGISPVSSTVGGSRLKTVGIIIAFIDNIGDILRVSSPTSLLPGMYLFGRVGLEFRSLIANSRLAALGSVTPLRTFIGGSIFDLTQDPAPPSHDTGVASLRVFVPSDHSDWYFIQEDQGKTVLAGIAALGGLWTSVGGIFSICFGGTLALVLWNQKPLSMFGLFDKPWEGTLRKEWQDKISNDRSAILDENDLIMIKLLREKWVDLGPLENSTRI